MKNKLTLRLEDKLIKKAKSHAKLNKTSVSKMIADYLSALNQSKQSEKKETEELPPITAKLAGILEGKQIEEEEYRNHLEEKHLK